LVDFPSKIRCLELGLRRAMESVYWWRRDLSCWPIGTISLFCEIYCGLLADRNFQDPHTSVPAYKSLNHRCLTLQWHRS